MDLYINDPFAKQKIDYILNKNEQKLKRDKVLAASIKAMDMNKSK